MRVYTLVLSLVAHLLFFTSVVVASLVATDVLPEPYRVLEYIRVTPAPAPTPPQAFRSREQSVRDTVPRTVAPIEPPLSIEQAPTEMFDLGPSSIEGVVLGGNSISGELVPPPPVPRQREPVRVGGLITRPERVHDVAPAYPPVARAAKIEGTVILEAVIGTDGAVREVRVLRSVSLLDSAAVEAVRQWRFTPTLLNGDAVPVVMTVTVTFTLR